MRFARVRRRRASGRVIGAVPQAGAKKNVRALENAAASAHTQNQ
jgi:hypothetical protein